MTAMEGKMIRVLGAVSASLMVLSACGGGGASPATGAPAAAGGGTEVAVTAEGFRFSPQSIEVKTGGTVTWTNKDGAPHTTTSGKPGAATGRWEGNIPPSGGTFVLSFPEPGTYDYFCAIHTSMTARVTVK